MPLYDGMTAGLNANRQIEDIAFTYNVVAKTVDYTVLATESGTVFTTYGATEAEIVFTLPTAATGLNYMFLNAVDNEIRVIGAANDLLVVDNNATADYIVFTEAGEQIGSGFQVICDGTYWFVIPIFGAEDATLTVTDAG
jgi:hypothetical protein